MATLRLWIEKMPTGEYGLARDLETEFFITAYSSGLWIADVEAVRALAVGKEYESGGGTMPGWKVRRID